MEAIENIKNQISKKYTFIINTSEELPCLAWVFEIMSRYRKDAKEALARMSESCIFSSDEIQEVADFAERTIRDRGACALDILKEMKRERFIF